MDHPEFRCYKIRDFFLHQFYRKKNHLVTLSYLTQNNKVVMLNILNKDKSKLKQLGRFSILIFNGGISNKLSDSINQNLVSNLFVSGHLKTNLKGSIRLVYPFIVFA